MGKPLALTLVVLLLMSVATFTLPVEAQGSSKTQITLGLKKDFDGKVTGDPDNALPSLVRVGETHLVYGRLMQLPDGKNFQPLPNGEVKLIDVFNNAQNPIVLATAKSDKDGFFVFEWKVSTRVFKQHGVFKLQEGITSLENVRLQILGVYEGDPTHTKSTSRGYIVQLKPQRLDVSIQTDKRLYTVGESAHVTVMFKTPTGELVDPDMIEMFFGPSTVSPVRQNVGTYFFTSPPLSENIHKVTVLFDKEDYLREIRSATITASVKAALPVDLNAMLDRDTYGLGELLVITGTVKPVMEGRLVLINVNNPDGTIYNFGHVTPNADGTFKHEFRLVGPLAITGEWKATYTYLGSQIIDSFSVRELPTKFLQVTVQSSSLVTDIGETLEEVELGSPVGIQAELANEEREEITLTYIVQVKDAEGFTVMLSWIKGIALKPDMSLKPAIFWIPQSKGFYDVEIFMWESLENPVPRSAPKTLEIVIA
jgi:hypothetical protein